MRGRALLLAAFAAVTATAPGLLAGACSGDAFTAATSDAGATTADAGDATGSDDVTDAGAGAGDGGGDAEAGGPWCATYAPGAAHCFDFDETADPLAGWTGASFGSTGTLALDPLDPRSPPNALRIETAAPDGGANGVFQGLFLTVPAGPPTHAIDVAFDLHAVRKDVTAEVVEIDFENGGSGENIVLRLSAQPGDPVVLEDSRDTVSLPLVVNSGAFDVWARVEIGMTWSETTGVNATVRVDGRDVTGTGTVAFPAFDVTALGGQVNVFLAHFAHTTTTGWQLDYDDVVIGAR